MHLAILLASYLLVALAALAIGRRSMRSVRDRHRTLDCPNCDAELGLHFRTVDGAIHTLDFESFRVSTL